MSDASNAICKDVNFECSEKGLQVQSMESVQVALVSLVLRGSAFADFKCDRLMSLGMNVGSVGKMMKRCGPNDSLKISWQHDSDTATFQCQSSQDDRITDFNLKLMQICGERVEIPEKHYKVVAKLPSGEVQKICRDLKEFGETMQISGSKEWVRFSVQGDIGAGIVMLKPRESEKLEECVALKVCAPVTATFALRYLSLIHI